MSFASFPIAEHPLDVLTALTDWRQAGDAVALAVVRRTEGGAVRAIGALMAVHEDGRSAGYVSGGCIDADLVLRAQAAIARGKGETVLYGAGSPFVDLPLPCGGAIEIGIIAQPCATTVAQIVTALTARREITVVFAEAFGLALANAERPMAQAIQVTYEPKMRLRLAGRGADCLTLAKIAMASGFAVDLYCLDGADRLQAQQMGLTAKPLTSPQALPAITDDAQTAFVLMFHDGDWETPLLRQALCGPAFYIGAVGSRHTHAKRRAALLEAGATPTELNRIRGPIGLVPSLRNASELAISTLAEIIDTYQTRITRLAGNTALILLAAGQSRRFGADDKLLATLGDKAVIDHAIDALPAYNFGRKIAVTSAANDARAQHLEQAGWDISANPHAARGQSTSLKMALNTIQADTSISHILVLLADMPHIPAHHLEALLRAGAAGHAATMTRVGDTLLPPTLIARDRFDVLQRVSGDMGARQALQAAGAVFSVPLSPQQAVDIDTNEDLELAERVLDG